MVRVRHVAAVVKFRKKIVVEVSILLCFKVQWLRLGITLACLGLDNIAQFFSHSALSLQYAKLHCVVNVCFPGFGKTVILC